MSTFLLVFSWTITVCMLLWSWEVPQWIERNVLKNPQKEYKDKIAELEVRIAELENRKAELGSGK